ncbi:MAG: Mth938-like domain-containing protein [Gammaproteobacteria bacterium]|nr:Mth938-like domain-containing protein [Gammaproteobacteria bacterium]MCP5196419.1 Mth938-like domain-containing protein [Gammaproteobacteria bacterium]
MRFSLDTDTSKHFIKSYGPGWINVNEQQIRRSVVVTPERLITDWPPQTFTDLEGQHFETIMALEPEIVLLGTGDHQRFPHPRLIQALLTQGVGVEIMDTAAACRTYNIIMLEDRQVAAALLMIAAD